MTRGHRGSLLLRCKALSSSSPCRFIPAFLAVQAADLEVGGPRLHRRRDAELMGGPKAESGVVARVAQQRDQRLLERIGGPQDGVHQRSASTRPTSTGTSWGAAGSWKAAAKTARTAAWSAGRSRRISKARSRGSLGSAGAVGEHGELVVAELQEAAVNLEGVLTGGALDAHRRVGELQQRRLVAGQDADLTFDAAGVDLVGLAVVQPLLRRHDRHAHDRHQDSRRRLAFAMTSSTPPTMENACSGYSSRSPLMSASKDSIVSDSGTLTPGEPVNCSATKKAWEKKRCTLRARCTVSLSSSVSSSMPRMAMMSCRSR